MTIQKQKPTFNSRRGYSYNKPKLYYVAKRTTLKLDPYILFKRVLPVTGNADR